MNHASTSNLTGLQPASATIQEYPLIALLGFPIDDCSHALAAAHTCVGATVPASLLVQDAGQSPDETDTGGSQSMTDRGASPHYIDPLRIDAQLLDAVEGYDTEGLVYFPVIDVCGL